MKVTCGIVEDLMPLYHDGVCSKDSRVLVEEHLEECGKCRELLTKMSEELEHPAAVQGEMEALQDIRAKWMKMKKVSLFKGVLISLCVFGILTGIFVGMAQWRIVPVPTEAMEVSDVSQISNSAVKFHLKIEDNKELRCILRKVTEDGVAYISPMRTVFEQIFPIGESGVFSDRDIYFYVGEDAPEEPTEGIIFQYPENVREVYLGVGKDSILLWQEGTEQVLP